MIYIKSAEVLNSFIMGSEQPTDKQKLVENSTLKLLNKNYAKMSAYLISFIWVLL